MKFDQIGKWSQIKLDIIGEYAVPYATIMSAHGFRFYYIDAFCGAGMHIDKGTLESLDGSPLRVLGIQKPFNKYHFIDLDGDKTKFLQDLCKRRFPQRDVSVRTGDCNEILKELLPNFSRERRDRLFCLLDPYGLHLDWQVIEQMGKSGIVDLALNFPVMDMNMNAIWRNPDKVRKHGTDRMNRFWGDDSWKTSAYEPGLFSSTHSKRDNLAIADAFRARLKTVAGFDYVAKPLAMKNSTGATVYYLFFASKNKTADKIMTFLFNKYGKQQ